MKFLTKWVLCLLMLVSYQSKLLADPPPEPAQCKRLQADHATDQDKDVQAANLSAWGATKAASRGMFRWINRVKFVSSLGLIKVIGKYNSWFSKNFVRSYSNLLNQGLDANIISVAEAKQHIETLKAQGINLLMGEKDRVITRPEEGIIRPDTLKSLYQQVLTRLEEIPVDREQWFEQWEKMNITEQEYQALSLALPQVKNMRQVDDLFLFLTYSRGVKPHQRAETLAKTTAIFDPQDPSVHIKKFQKGKKAAVRFQAKERQRQTKKVGKMTAEEVGATRLSREELIAERTNKITERYKLLYFGCRARTVNVDRMAANKKLLFSILGLETINGIGSFAVVHRNDPIDDVWKKKLLMSLMVSLPWAIFRAKLTSASGVDIKWKMFTDYMMANVLAVLPALAYESELGVSNEEIAARAKAILEHPDFKPLLTKYIAILEENFGDEIKTGTMPKIGDLSPMQIEKIVEGHAELDETEEWLRTAIARELYEERKGSLDTGSVGLDYWTFGRIWGVNSSVRNIAIGLVMYHILCMGQLNPIKAYIMAFGLFTINKVINEYLYLDLMFKATGI